jgi:outer membrane protein TolC
MRQFKYFLLIITCLAVDSTVLLYAQESLSLSQAIQIGMKQNYDIALTQKNVEINTIQNTWGQAGRYPTISMNIKQGNTISDQSNNPTSFIQALLMANSIEGGANLNWTLFNGFRVQANKEKLEKLQEQSEGLAALVVENTIQGIILNYYSAKLQEEKLQLLKHVLDLSRDKWKYQQTRQEMGLALTIDLLQYESAYYTDSTNLLLQELAYRNAIRNLNLLMAVPETQLWQLSDELAVVNETYDYLDLKAKMLSSNQNLKNEMVNLEILQRDISLAKSTMYPVIGFQMGASGTTSTFKIAEYPRIGGTNLNYYANFTLNFTLYDGGKVKRGIQALEVQNVVNSISMDQMRDRLSQELMANYDLYTTRLQLMDLAKQSFSLTQRNMDMMRLRENSGLVNSFVFREIEMAYLRAGLTLYEIAFQLVESKTNMIRLIGGLLEE